MEFFRNRRDNDRPLSFIIDAFKNPSEIEYFRNRYGRFFLVSVYADEEIRRKRFGQKLESEYGIHHEKAEEIFIKVDKQDRGEDTYEPKRLYVQGVSECSYLADIAFNNDKDPKDPDFIKKLTRYLALILEPGCTQPTPEETLMSLAYSLSLRSTVFRGK